MTRWAFGTVLILAVAGSATGLAFGRPARPPHLDYRTGPPPAHTGAFGEPDCTVCHFDAVRDDALGSVTLEMPRTYRPGADYTITARVRYPDVRAAGFQLTTRFAEGPRAGEQAGALTAASGRTRVARQGGIAYASHSVDGTWPAGENEDRETAAGESAGVEPAAGEVCWALRWTAPERGGAVAIDVAAQVANDDDSEFGERFYETRVVVRPLPRAHHR